MNKSKRFIESKKKMNEENIRLRIENEVLKKQLKIIRNNLNELIGEVVGDTNIAKLWDEVENELIKGGQAVIIKKGGNYAVGGVNNSVIIDDKEKKPTKCHNCQKLGYYERGFCVDC